MNKAKDKVKGFIKDLESIEKNWDNLPALDQRRAMFGMLSSILGLLIEESE